MKRVGIILVDRFFIAAAGLEQIFGRNDPFNLLHFVLKVFNKDQNFGRRF